MHGTRGLASVCRIVLAFALATAAVAGPWSTPRAAAAAGLPRWDGSIDLYRSGVFTTQRTWLWCTAADVQIVRNIVDRDADHSRASQQRYFDAMRAHNRYDIPVADGVDPAGWRYGLRRFVDSRYRLVASRSFDAALRSAVTSLRRTNLPVGITVAHGTHAWVLTGFTATADPAATARFTVTSVRVVGPLWGLQSRSYGYDMRPDTKLTARQLAGFFTPWHYAGVRMAWEGRWVSIQPLGASAATPAPTPTPPPSATASSRPTPTLGPIPSAASPAVASPGSGVSGSPPGGVADGGPGSTGGAGAPFPGSGDPQPTASAQDAWMIAGALAALGALLTIGATRVRARNGRGGAAAR
jgi:hypothetical protein